MPPHSQQSAATFSLPKKSFRQAEKAFETLKKFQKLVIKNKRHPSWVSFVTIFLPVSQRFTTFLTVSNAAVLRSERGGIQLAEKIFSAS